MKTSRTVFNFDRLIDHLVGFIETRFDILKLDVKEESIKVLARLMTLAVIALLGTLFFIFFSVALGIYLNQLLDSAYLGFAILAAFFFLLWMAVLIIKRTHWYHKFIASLTDQIVEASNDNQENERGPEISGNSQ